MYWNGMSQLYVFWTCLKIMINWWFWGTLFSDKPICTKAIVLDSLEQSFNQKSVSYIYMYCTKFVILYLTHIWYKLYV